MSQQLLADDADISKRTIQKIESGELNPSLIILSSIARALEIPLKELVDFPVEE